MTDVDDKIIKRARVNRLLADYVARREVEEGADASAALKAVRGVRVSSRRCAQAHRGTGRA